MAALPTKIQIKMDFESGRQLASGSTAYDVINSYTRAVITKHK